MSKRPPGRSRRRRGPGRTHAVAPAGDRPVPLHKRSASHFERADRQRGEEYFEQGRVRLQVEGTRARARVEGRERDAYGVGLDWSQVGERVLHAFCECQRFAEGKPCKHVWATLLALAESGPDNQPPGRDRVSLRRDRPASWQDLGLAVDAEAARPQRPIPGVHLARPARHAERGRSRQRGGEPDDERTAGAASWRSQLATLREAIEQPPEGPAARDRASAPPDPDLRLLVDTSASRDGAGLVLDCFVRSSDNGKLKRTSLEPGELEAVLQPRAGSAEPGPDDARSEGLAEEAERPQVAVVAALPVVPGRPGRGRRPVRTPPVRLGRLRLPSRLYGEVLPALCARGVLGWWDGRTAVDSPVLSWDDGEPWRLALRLERTAGGGARLGALFERAGERRPLDAAQLLLPAPEGEVAADGASIVVFRDAVARLDMVPHRDLPWLGQLRESGEMVFPKADLDEALASLLEMPALPPIEAPDELQLSRQDAAPQPRLVLEPDDSPEWTNPPLIAQLSFVYGSLEVAAGDPRAAVVDWEERTFVQRDMDRERDALVRLLELGMRPVQSAEGHGLELPPRELPAVAEPLLAEGWAVEVHGTSLRAASPPALRIESGIDWFELSGDVDFAGERVDMGRLLSAVRSGDRFIELAGGGRGLVPASWMETYDSLAKLAQGDGEDGLRFLHSQALLVDALLVALPAPSADKAFLELRQKLRSFERIKPKKELASFGGTLRGYQREGLGWLEFLREFGLGGVLADDMGLGKTVQVLALIQAHRTPSKTTGLPWLVVAPRSLVYNWVDEAARFTPKLSVVEYHGADRDELRGHLHDYDIVVTTYGTLRRDIGYLATVEFDTVVLDEAQAIKNPESQTAKASRLLAARHRLALTGTPIENHLGELGSLFEFLNPGLLGRLPRLEVLVSGGAPTQSQLALVAEGIRPFILRRTKAQVLSDLPPKTEQVLFCSLRPEQRELYDRLRAEYQASLLAQVEAKGVGGSTMQVLEALLRLRQVACHPGLVHDEWEEAGSAKLEALYDQVDEVLEEGHKILVFSQFTSLLAYVRRHLDEREIEYAYLDGATRDRGAQVERFQTDPGCNLFLVSLKAGGVGLNLTAAGYVFLLDPWWNPAVEAQAIDRAHRIGQTQPVFAYRLIARDTVEEKMLELQRTKRQLAEAVLDGGEQSIASLTADDLRLLLS